MRGTAQDSASGDTWPVEAIGAVGSAGASSGGSASEDSQGDTPPDDAQGDTPPDDAQGDTPPDDTTSGDAGEGPQQIRLAFRSKKIPAELPESFDVTLIVRQTPGKVLAVPSTAVHMMEDGSTSVTVVGADGDHRTVVVETGMTGAGMVEVSPVGGELAAGDKVVVGREAS